MAANIPISARQLSLIRWLAGILELTPLELSDLAWRFSNERVDRIEELTTKEAARALTSLKRRQEHLPAYHAHLRASREVPPVPAAPGSVPP